MNKAFLAITVCIFALINFALINFVQAGELGTTVNGMRYGGPAYDRSKDRDPDELTKNTKAAEQPLNCSESMNGTGLNGNVLHPRKGGGYEFNHSFYTDGATKIVSTITKFEALPKLTNAESAYRFDYLDVDKVPVHGFIVLNKNGSVKAFATQKAGEVHECPYDPKSYAAIDAKIKTCASGRHREYTVQSWWRQASRIEREYVCTDHVL